MKNARIASSTTTTATGIPTSIPVFELLLWASSCGEGELVDVLVCVADTCVEVATAVWLVDCAEVPRLKTDDEADSAEVIDEPGTEAVKVVLGNAEEPSELAVVD